VYIIDLAVSIKIRNILFIKYFLTMQPSSATSMNDRSRAPFWAPETVWRYRTHQEEIEEDVPQELEPGWRFGGHDYIDRGFNRACSVVTRPSNYVPYQLIAEPDGRHAYNPAARKYPQSYLDERMYQGN
jgi:hypothetical protein